MREYLTAMTRFAVMLCQALLLFSVIDNKVHSRWQKPVFIA